jgi:hypothetical protein
MELLHVSRINRDVIIALALLIGCGVLFVESLNIEETSYGTIQSHVWPQILLAGLTVFSLLLLGQAVRSGGGGRPPSDGEPGAGGFGGWLRRYRNALWCYALFFGFLVTLPVLGMLLGGGLFVFLTLTILGKLELRAVPLHAAIAVVSVGAMWAVFTFGLRVFLPDGTLLNLQ